MEAVENDEEYDIINPRTGRRPARTSARKVFEHIVDLAWKNGEPGIIFLDRLNRDNPTPQVGEIEATNPCGEQPLLPYESCNLGSINLARMVTDGDQSTGTSCARSSRLAVHFLDNVIEVNNYPIPQIDEMTRANRKIGLGVMGWADMLILLGIPYDSDEAVELGEKVMKFITDEGHAASRELAAERGAFPNFKGSIFDSKGGRADAQRHRAPPSPRPAPSRSSPTPPAASSRSLPSPTSARSSTTTSSSRSTRSSKRSPRSAASTRKELMEKIAEHGTVQDIDEIPEDIRRVFVTAHDITPEDHIRMQAAFQKHTDNAVSKTVNFCHDATGTRSPRSTGSPTSWTARG